MKHAIRNSRAWRTFAQFARSALPGSRRRYGEPTPGEYARWIAEFEQQNTPAARLERTPLISVVVNGAPAGATVESVAAQSYDCWELLISDGAPTSDARIRVVRNPAAGARGEYILTINSGDTLAADALACVAAAAGERPDADVIYSDEDVIDGEGRRSAPFFKPDWSPDLAAAWNYVGDLCAIRTVLLWENESQTREALLSRACNVVHIPRVLYHRSRRPTGTGSRVRYEIPADARLSVLIPSGGKLEVLRRNVDSLFHESRFRAFEVVIVDNSTGVAIERYAAGLMRGGWPVRYCDQRNQPFNYSRLNNSAAATCNSDLLLFLNDDTRLIEAESLNAMVELAARPEVGAVGAKLLYPDGRIQHAGVVMGIYGVCGHAFRGAPASERHYFGFPDLVRNVSAVTGACMMVRADVFARAKGFDEEAFPIAYNDVDLCLRIGRLGYRVLYSPDAVFTHYEAYSKKSGQLAPDPSETKNLVERWRDVIENDPFYSPNLTRTAEDYSLRRRRGGAATVGLPE